MAEEQEILDGVVEICSWVRASGVKADGVVGSIIIAVRARDF